MITRYNTGDAVLIPATIRSAEERDGQIIYHVDAETWEGIEESLIVADNRAEAQRAMQKFVKEIAEKW